MPDRITPAQMRGARGMLDWSIGQLADAAQLSASTIKRMEMAGPQPVSDAAYGIMRDALEKAGIQFLSDDGNGTGMRMRSC